jgi:hypothetical protein
MQWSANLRVEILSAVVPDGDIVPASFWKQGSVRSVS